MIKRILFIAAVALGFMSAPASANAVFDISGATFSAANGGGSMTGTITLSDDLKTLVDVSITVPGGVSYPYTFTPFTYTMTGDSTLKFQNGGSTNTYLQIDITTGGVSHELQVYLTGLTSSGASFSIGHAYDFENTAGSRQLTAGTLALHVDAPAPVPVPEPSSLALLLAGLGMIALGLFASGYKRFANFA